MVKNLKDNKLAWLSYGDAPQPVQATNDAVYPVLMQQKKEYIRFSIFGDHAFNLYFTVQFKNLDRNALEKSLKALVERHESLRTVYLRRGDEIMQRVQSVEEFFLKINYHDITAVLDQSVEIEKLRKLTGTRFNFEKGPLFCVHVIDHAADFSTLLIVIHHAISDNASLFLMKEEIVALYDNVLGNKLTRLNPLKLQYKDYAHWVNSLSKSEKFMEQVKMYKQKISLSISLEKETPAYAEIKTRHEKVESYLDIPLSVLCPVLLNYHKNTQETLASFHPNHETEGSGHFDFKCDITEYENVIEFRINYNIGTYGKDEVAAFMNMLVEILEQVSFDNTFSKSVGEVLAVLKTRSGLVDQKAV